MVQKKLIPSSLRSSGAFRRDLKALLSLSSDQLIILGRIASESTEGFSAGSQAAPLADEMGISVDEARHAVLVADLLYERCRSERISVDEAVEQLATISQELDLPDVTEKTAALGQLLSIKKLYEGEGYVRSQARSIVAHLMNLDGVWDIRPVFHRDTGEITKRLPVLILTASWHDDVGESHNATFQLDEDDWVDFQEKVQELARQRSALGEYLEQP